MNIILDTKTLTLVDAIVALAICVAMVFIWRTRKTYPGFGLWTIAVLSMVVGFLLLILRGQISDFWSILIANLFLYASYLLLFEGIRRFRGKTGILWTTYIFFLVMLVSYVYFTFIHPDLKARMAILSVLYGITFFQSSMELAHHVPKELRLTHWFTSNMFFIYGFASFFRFILVIKGPIVTDFFEPDLLMLIVTFLIPIPVVIVWSFGLVIMNAERLEHELNNVHAELTRLAMNDSLTGIYNNRYFFEIGKTEVIQAQRYQHPLAIIIYDIDYFKQINDTFGHLTGDLVLVSLVATTQKCLREADILGRLGGDEFGLILPQTDIKQAGMVAERLRQMIESSELSVKEGTVRFTVSIGVSEVHLAEEGIEQAIKRADDAMYEAKRGNRNMVVLVNGDS